MNTTVINIKTNPDVKKAAQQIAEDLGFSLSSLLNGYLRHLIRTKTVHFSTEEEPTEYLLEALKESKEDIKAGRVISFLNSDQAVNYLDELIEHEKKSKD